MLNYKEMWSPMKYLPFLLFCLFAVPAFAEEHSHGHQHDLMPPLSIDKKAPAVYLSMDKSELVQLDENAASIIVGNPVHANVLMDNPRLLVIVPRAPGATHFTVLNQMGDVIMQRHIIVASPKDNYVRVRKSTCGEDTECIKTESYYCEEGGMCHQIISALDEEAASGNNEETGNEQPQDPSLEGSGEEPQ